MCAQWPVQFLDGARGEDVLASAEVPYVPASFARVRLDTQGAAQDYSAFPPNTYRTLDADGCLPPDVTPTPSQLTAASADFEVKMTWLGALSLPVGSAGEELDVQIERMRVEDPWTACGCTGAPFERPAAWAATEQGTWACLGTTNDCDPYPDDSEMRPVIHEAVLTAPADADGGWVFNPLAEQLLRGATPTCRLPKHRVQSHVG